MAEVELTIQNGVTQCLEEMEQARRGVGPELDGV